MSSTSLDLSASTDLAWVADLARPVLNAAKDVRIFIVGAMAAIQHAAMSQGSA